MSQPAAETSAPTTARGRAVGAIVWSGFLSAAAGTMVCFAFVDPQALSEGDPPSWWTTRPRVYAIGFFFFWFLGLVAAGLSWFLARPAEAPPR